VELYRYWDSRRGLRPMPRRADIDPVDMRAWLPRITLIEVGDGGERMRYRVVGTEVAGLRGFDPTGWSVESAFPREDAERVLADYRDVIAQKKPVFCHPAERTPVKRDPVIGVMLLPLSADGETVDQVLGYLGDDVGAFDPVI
jgi:hypothetical protein